jgi:hypothetical protein
MRNRWLSWEQDCESRCAETTMTLSGGAKDDDFVWRLSGLAGLYLAADVLMTAARA